jgi:uncharacterized protein YjiS (DUF1127 family)
MTELNRDPAIRARVWRPFVKAVADRRAIRRLEAMPDSRLHDIGILRHEIGHRVRNGRHGGP